MWHECVRRECLFHLKAKALAVFMVARQLGNHASHLDIAPLPFVGKAYGLALLGQPCGVVKTESAGKGGN